MYTAKNPVLSLLIRLLKTIQSANMNNFSSIDVLVLTGAHSVQVMDTLKTKHGAPCGKKCSYYISLHWR